MQRNSSSGEGADDLLSVEETLGLAFIAGFEDEGGERYYARVNPAAKDALYKVLENDTLRDYHPGVWRILGRIGDEDDFRRLAAAIEEFKGESRLLTQSEQSTLRGYFGALGLMCRRDVKGATDLAYKMQTLEFWGDAHLRWWANAPSPPYPPVEYQSINQFMPSYAASLRPDVAECVRAIAESGRTEEERKVLRVAFSAEFARNISAGARTSILDEQRTVPPEQREALRRSFNGDLENPGPPEGVLAAEKAARREHDDFMAGILQRQEAAKAAITDPHARQLLDLAKDVMFEWDDNTMELTGEVRLILDGPTINDDVLALVDALPGITHLQIENAAITDEGLRHLAALGKLESLYVSSNEAVTDKGLGYLEGVGSLKRLHLARLPRVDDDGLKHVGAMANLDDVTLDELGVTFAGLKYLADLKRLRGLYVSFAPDASDATAQPPADVLQPEPDAGTPTVDASTPVISARAQRLLDLAADVNLGARGEVTALSLHGDKITNDTLAMLDAVPELTHLALIQTSITDDGLRHLATLSRLKSLSLVRESGLTDAGLAHLAALDSVEGISLQGLAITFAGLDHLANMKQLRRLEIHFSAPTPRPRQ